MKTGNAAIQGAFCRGTVLNLSPVKHSERFDRHSQGPYHEESGLSYAIPSLTAPSFNGRTADSGSAYRGSNPWGAARISRFFSIICGVSSGSIQSREDWSRFPQSL